MDDRRRQELRESLERQLEQEGQTLSGRDRVLWLTHRLDLYVGRFLGLATSSGASASPLLDHDLFHVIGIGADVVSTVLQASKAPPALLGSWRQFRDSLREVGRATDAKHLPDLTAALAHWQSSLAATQW